MPFFIFSAVVAGIFASNLSHSKIPSYLGLHTAIELFSIVISIMIFLFRWNLRGQNQSRHFAILGTSFLLIGFFDFFHTLSYAGMPDLITPSGVEKAIYFWLAARFTQALAAVAIVSIYDKNDVTKTQCQWATASLSIFALGVSYTLIFYADYLPRVFIQGEGLTSFKIYSEYFIFFSLAFASVLLLKKMSIKNFQEDKQKIFILKAFLFMILSEFCFTRYLTHDDLTNLLGHIFKLVSFNYLYRGILKQEFLLPYDQLDQTRRKLQIETENLRSMKNELERAERLAALGTMMSGIAHDLANVLTIIAGNAAIIEKHNVEPNLKIRQKVTQIELNVDRAKNFIKSLLNFSKNIETKQELIDVASILNDSAITFEPFLKEIEIRLSIETGESVFASKSDIEQILLNLIVNARDAIGTNPGKIQILGKTSVLTEVSHSVFGTIPAGEYYCLSIKDNGIGISPELMPKIFKPFFSTKEKNAGTGLGLANVACIVKKLKGFIEVYSIENVGTEFLIYIPTAKQKAESSPQSAA